MGPSQIFGVVCVAYCDAGTRSVGPGAVVF